MVRASCSQHWLAMAVSRSISSCAPAAGRVAQIPAIPSSPSYLVTVRCSMAACVALFGGAGVHRLLGPAHRPPELGVRLTTRSRQHPRLHGPALLELEAGGVLDQVPGVTHGYVTAVQRRQRVREDVRKLPRERDLQVSAGVRHPQRTRQFLGGEGPLQLIQRSQVVIEGGDEFQLPGLQPRDLRLIRRDGVDLARLGEPAGGHVGQRLQRRRARGDGPRPGGYAVRSVVSLQQRRHEAPASLLGNIRTIIRDQPPASNRVSRYPQREISIATRNRQPTTQAADRPTPRRCRSRSDHDETGRRQRAVLTEVNTARRGAVRNYVVRRTTCGSWSLAWSLNSELMCTTWYESS